MATGATGSDPVATLGQFSVLSLFPPTFGVPQAATDPYDLERELDALHTHLGTTALRSPKKLLDQAKAVVQKSSELPSSDVGSRAAADEGRELDAAKADGNPRKRRPGVGHKRPRFSLKPDSSQPAANLEVAFDIDSYDDPDEFFAAYERFERAKTEIMRQNGTLLEDQPQHKLNDQRPRRPGLLGRSYKNRFAEPVILPAETVTDAYVAVSSPIEEQDARTDINDESQGRNATGLKKGKRDNDEILDELLSQNLEDLDGDGAANLLQEHLEIQIINVENLELPELQDIRKDNLNASVGNLSKKRPALLDIQNLMKGPDMQSLTKLRGGPENSKSYLSSRSRSKSPLAQISLLKQRLFRESTSADPFSSVHVDEEAVRSSLDAEQSERHPDDVNKRKSAIFTDHPYETVGVSLDRRDFDVDIESNSNNNLQRVVGNSITDLPMIDELLDRSGSDLNGQGDTEAPATTAEIEDSIAEEANQDVNLGPLVSSIVEEFVRDSTSKCTEGIPEQQMEEPRAASPKRQEGMKSSLSCEGRTKKASRPNTRGATKKPVGGTKRTKNLAVTECQPAKKADAVPEELIKEVPQEMRSGETPHIQSPKRPRLKKKVSDRRASLGGAGTKWANGVRRSTRIKTRPLAYWKGERYLYGRIHQSLATIIGMKYESPGKADGRPHLKVKSFVSDEYQELLDLVS